MKRMQIFKENIRTFKDEKMETFCKILQYLERKKNALEYFLFAFFRFVGDCQINLALNMFIKGRGKELLEKHLDI